MWISLKVLPSLFIIFFSFVEDSFAQAPGYSLRFYGNGQNDLDRVKISIDDPEVPADVAGSFTLEFWMKVNPGENTASGCSIRNDNWIFGNIMFDRDVFGAGDFGDYGVSLFTEGLAFGVNNGTSGTGLCGTTDLADGGWHHIAVTRREADGLMTLFVDGTLEANIDGPEGDVSYRNGRSTNYPNSDPFLVIGAEKHDAGTSFPSYSGWIDEVRLSNVVRYTENFSVPTLPFVTDMNTVALYHFDEGAGDVISDSSKAAGGPSPGVRRFGGDPAGPEWSTDTPFNNPVPIELASFKAKVTPVGEVLLEWMTLSETINFGFEVQRKSGPDGEFNTLPNSFIPGHGTTTTPQSYTFLDRTVTAGRWRYRLKQIDLDGAITIHEEIEVEVSRNLRVPQTFALHQNYPNPFNATTKIRYDIVKRHHVLVQVYSLTGIEVMSLVDDDRPAGSFIVTWDGKSSAQIEVASGVYFVKLTSRGRSVARKMILLR